MANVADAFVQGSLAGQAVQEHQQAMEENKLRTVVLKHQIEGMKIDDQLRARDIARQNLSLMATQPGSDLPSDAVTSDQPNLPSRNLAGVVTGLIRGGQGIDQGNAAPVTASSAPTMPGSLPAPAAQAEQPGTNPITTQVRRKVTIPGVDAFNGAPAVPGLSVTPRSMEDVIRAQVMAKQMEPYNLGEGQRRFVGSDMIAQGGSKEIPVPAGGRLYDPATKTTVAVGGAPNTEFGQFQQAYAGKFGKTSFSELTPAQQAGVFPAFAKERRDPAIAALAGDRIATAKAARKDAEDLRLWSAAVSNGWKQHASDMAAWKVKAQGTMSDTPPPEPQYTPPSFDDWRAQRDAAAPTASGAPKPSAQGAPAEGTIGTIKGQPVVWKTIGGKSGWYTR